MWRTRLLVLGLVRWLGPVHGYDVFQQLAAWNVFGDERIRPGSIYHSLKKMTSQGLLEIVSTEQQSGKPARTSYRTTAGGNAEFHRLLRDRLWARDTTTQDFGIAWSMAPALSDPEAIAILRHRAAVLTQHMDECVAFIANTAETPDSDDQYIFIPPHVKALNRLGIQQNAVAADWCDETANQIESGELELSGDPSPEEAQHWRESISKYRIKNSTRETSH